MPSSSLAIDARFPDEARVLRCTLAEMSVSSESPAQSLTASARRCHGNYDDKTTAPNRHFFPRLLPQNASAGPVASSSTWRALARSVVSAAGPPRAVAVLVVATPCRLILAAPVAFVAGLSRAARRGVVVKGGACSNGFGRGTTLLIDKTGTLTKGCPVLAAIIPAGEFAPNQNPGHGRVTRLGVSPCSGQCDSAGRRRPPLRPGGPF